ncbi:MAG: hypothetical protein RSG57_03970, partial [Christensenellaceae bacterium]
EVRAEKRTVCEIPILIGRSQNGQVLTHEQCRDILDMPIERFTEDGRTAACWLRTSSKLHALDALVPVESMLTEQTSTLSEAQSEEVAHIKQRAKIGKSDISHSIDDLQLEVGRLEHELHNLTSDRMKTITLQRQLTLKRQELLKKQDSQFFEAMQLDVEIEKQVNDFLGKEKLTAKVVRQFVVEVTKLDEI